MTEDQGVHRLALHYACERLWSECAPEGPQVAVTGDPPRCLARTALSNPVAPTDFLGIEPRGSAQIPLKKQSGAGRIWQIVSGGVPIASVVTSRLETPAARLSGVLSEVGPQAQSPAAALAAFVDELLLTCLDESQSLDELAVLLDVSKTEVKRWCLRLVDQGGVRKLTKPLRFVRQLPTA